MDNTGGPHPTGGLPPHHLRFHMERDERSVNLQAPLRDDAIWTNISTPHVTHPLSGSVPRPILLLQCGPGKCVHARLGMPRGYLLPKICFPLPYPSDSQTLIGFHLSLLMGYVNSVPYFCCTRDIVANLKTPSGGTVLPHHCTNSTCSWCRHPPLPTMHIPAYPPRPSTPPSPTSAPNSLWTNVLASFVKLTYT